MRRKLWQSALAAAIAALSLACATAAEEPGASLVVNPEAFKRHWRQGKAEVTRYALKQSRYGEIHEGDAVLIFVTEDFLADKQVKRDFGSDQAYSVLKLNFTKKFQTGVYPYSLMTSVFTKIDFERPWTAKATFTGQEWCGHVFMQLNHRQSGYDAALYSYFQSEGDARFELPDAPLEDEVWVWIRLAPGKLPLGELEMVPSMDFLRLRHREAKPYKVTASLDRKTDATFAEESLYVYSLRYAELERRLDIYFRAGEPYEIVGWRETDPAGFGKSGSLTTVAVETHRMMLPYWRNNKNKDRALLEKLGLQ